jgi:hypothetical protein
MKTNQAQVAASNFKFNAFALYTSEGFRHNDNGVYFYKDGSTFTLKTLTVKA